MGIEVSTEETMIVFYNSLSEKDRRRFAAVEALRIGRGGITYISGLLGCDEKTIRKGLSELNNKESLINSKSIRVSGGVGLTH